MHRWEVPFFIFAPMRACAYHYPPLYDLHSCISISWILLVMTKLEFATHISGKISHHVLFKAVSCCHFQTWLAISASEIDGMHTGGGGRGCSTGIEQHSVHGSVCQTSVANCISSASVTVWRPRRGRDLAAMSHPGESERSTVFTSERSWCLLWEESV